MENADSTGITQLRTGPTTDEIAEELRISSPTLEPEWRFTPEWLYSAMKTKDAVP